MFGIGVGSILSTIKNGVDRNAQIQDATRQADDANTEQSIKTSVNQNTNKSARDAIAGAFESMSNDVKDKGGKMSGGYRA